MAENSIPVDLFNPGQVFACLGFLEAADALLGDAEGGFDWNEGTKVRFRLRAKGDEDPVRVILQFLAEAEVWRCLPTGPDDLMHAVENGNEQDDDDEGGDPVASDNTDIIESFPSRRPDAMALPVRLKTPTREIMLSHWADGSSRNDFKLYSGNRTAERITRAMLKGTRRKPSKKQSVGDLQTLGVAALWETKPNEVDPVGRTKIGPS